MFMHSPNIQLWFLHAEVVLYMIPVRPTPPPLVPPPPPCGVVRWWLPSPSLCCGGVRRWVCLLWFPPSPPVAWCGFGFSCGGYTTASLGLLWVFGILIPMMMIMMMGMMITIFIINSNILMFLWLVVGCLLPTCLVTIIALLIVGPLSS